jgi:hypothetical protein
MGSPRTTTPPISASQVARITDLSLQHLATFFFLSNLTTHHI